MNKIEAMEMFNCKCAKCNKVLNNDKYAHFHHLRSYNKIANMSDLFNHNDKLAKKEVKKTVLLCASCHIKLHKDLGKKVYKKDSVEWIRK